MSDDISRPPRVLTTGGGLAERLRKRIDANPTRDLEERFFAAARMLATQYGIPTERDELLFGRTQEPNAVRVSLFEAAPGRHMAKVTFGPDVPPDKATALEQAIRTDPTIQAVLDALPGAALLFAREHKAPTLIIPGADTFGGPSGSPFK